MNDMHFSDNYRDLSVQTGTDAGFQFEFYCEHCNDAWRSRFVPFRSGQASGWLGRASNLLGGALNELGNAVDGMAEAGFGRTRDQQFMAAIDDAKGHFHRCARCQNYVCDRCWNTSAGLCLSCAPSAEVEIEAAKAQGAVYGAGEKAVNEGIQRGKKMDVKRDRQLICPECGAQTQGAKFCPECGAKLAVKEVCPACQTEVVPGAKFCPECGEKLTP